MADYEEGEFSNLAFYPPHLEPLFSVGQWTPSTPCPHKGQLPKGSRFCCMKCHDSGLDGMAYFRKVKPLKKDRNPTSYVGLTVQKPKIETRRQRRSRLKTRSVVA